MATIAAWLSLEEPRLAAALAEAAEKLEGAGGEVVLDFGCVRRIDAAALGALEKFAGRAEKKGIQVVLRGVNVDVYKVLKLVKLTPRFCFEN